jgi:hypothetical protein
MNASAQGYYFIDSRDEYEAAIRRGPHGPCGPFGPMPILLVPMRPAALTTRRPLATHPAPSRPTSFDYAARPAALDRIGSRAVAPHATPPKICGGCGTPVTAAWLLWNVCICGRVRPPTPREESARLQLRLQLALPARGA